MRRSLFGLSIAFALGAAAAGAQPAPAYRSEKPVALPDGRWDLVSFDREHGRVLIARGDSVTVIDAAGGTARSIGAIAGGHAALAVPGSGLVAVTSGQDNTLRLLDGDSGAETARIPVGKKPDAALWDGQIRRVLVMNAGDGTVSVVDPVARRVEKSIASKPGLELPALVGQSLLAVNNEEASEVEMVDLAHGQALPPIALTGCQGPTGIAFDPADRLLLSACGNGKAAITDMRSRKVVQLVPIGQGPDTAMFDPRRRRFLVPCGRSGTLSVFSVDAHGKVAALPDIPTEPSARTGALDVASGRVFLPSARFQPAAVGQRPSLLPGTVHLLVLRSAG